MEVCVQKNMEAGHSLFPELELKRNWLGSTFSEQSMFLGKSNVPPTPRRLGLLMVKVRLYF